MAEEIRYHDNTSRGPLTLLAVSLGTVATLFMIAMLNRHRGTDEYVMIIGCLVLILIAWRTWTLARSPYLTLRSDDLLIQKFLRRYRISYSDITAITTESKTVRPRNYWSGSKANSIPITIRTLVLQTGSGRRIERVLPFRTDPNMLTQLERITAGKPQQQPPSQDAATVQP